jgi:Ala-tRNA(Pro) deacylase
MPATEDDLKAFLANLQIPDRTCRHPAVFTVEQAKALRGELPGAHAKNLFLKDRKGAFILAVTLEDRPVDLKDLRRRIGSAPLSFAPPDALRLLLGVEPGSVTPFAVINDASSRVRVVLDAEMMDAQTLNFHPLVNTATTAIAPADLLRFLEATGRAPVLVRF